jgi:hypothetical protein
MSVSILVVVDQFPEVWGRGEDVILDVGFQSLLWWISFRRMIQLPSKPNTYISFNPCCGGSVSGGVLQANNSLIYRGFNPCCGGSVSGGARTWAMSLTWHVSILVVVDQFPEAATAPPVSGYAVVSILVVVDQFPEGGSFGAIECFKAVSILVVVDQFPEELNTFKPLEILIVSILVVVDQFPEEKLKELIKRL